MNIKLTELTCFTSQLSIITSLLLASHTTFASAPFEGSAAPLPQAVIKQMKQYTWHEGCPVGLDGLSYLTLNYWGFDDKPHQGVLIVNAALGEEILGVFKQLYEQRFPIERMQPMYLFEGNDEHAMEENNTSSFNCRLITGSNSKYSKHAYGRAIDINPKINPYVKGDLILPKNAANNVDRSIPAKGKIMYQSDIYQLFITNGWDWGGEWESLQDYHHFEKQMNGGASD